MRLEARPLRMICEFAATSPTAAAELFALRDRERERRLAPPVGAFPLRRTATVDMAGAVKGAAGCLSTCCFL